ncbi:MAG: HEAT repeat domain-containing protein [Planctomycetes bacterium]|nr:HEAT repeat domain-containing protein [Planctomycetota bacterium]
MRHLLAVYSLLVTIATCGLAGAWWSVAGIGGEHRRPPPGETARTKSAAPSAPLREACPRCGRDLSAADAAGATDAAPPPPTTSDTPADPDATKPPENWPPRSLDDLPGHDLREKTRNFFDGLRSVMGGRTPEYPGQWDREREVENFCEEAVDQDPDGFVRLLLDLFRGEKDEHVGGLIAHGIEEMSPFSTTDAEEEEFARIVVDMRASPDPSDRRKALRLLHYSTFPGVVDSWLRLLATDPDPSVRATAAENLPLRFPDDPGGALDEVPSDHPRFRIPELRRSLMETARSDPDAGVRAAAIPEVFRFADTQEFTSMIEMLRQRPDPGLQEAIITGLSGEASHRDREARDALFEVARDPARPLKLRGRSIEILLYASCRQFVTDAGERQTLQEMLATLRASMAGEAGLGK